VPNSPNKLSQFWQELKRRKVVRVITVYAAAAFVILELTDIVAPSLGLPDWTLNFIIILLCVGFIIAVILSWIYDIHPEGGIVKTEPTKKVTEETVPPSSKGWKIASYISFVVIVGLIILNIIPRTGKKEIHEKSIAVLPFRNESSDEENTYFINGMMESILDNLCKIEDLRVISRNSVEKYRDKPQPTPVVAEEMDVSFVLEGSGQKIGNRLLLTVQLIVGKDDRHIWSMQYDREIEKVEDLFDIQKEIAQLVAGEIKVIITPEEQELIEKVPTTNLSAYDFYQRGREDYLKNWIDNQNPTALQKAEELFLKALDIDSSFAQAYLGLARVYWAKTGIGDYLSENYLDSMLILCDKALSYNHQLAESYTLKGFYYIQNDDSEKAVKEFDKAIRYNPNDWEAYRWKGRVYAFDNLVETIYNFEKAASLNHGSELPTLLRNLAFMYYQAGFPEKSKFYRQEATKLDGDSITYYDDLAAEENSLGNFKKSAELLVKKYQIDTNQFSILREIGMNFMMAGQMEQSLKYFKEYYKKLEAFGRVDPSSMHRIGYAYWKNGYKKEADYYFNKMVEYSNNLIAQGRVWAGTYYDLAGVYAFWEEKDKAYEYLRIFMLREIMPLWWLDLFKSDPLFESIKDEPEFQQILSDAETKYQAEHERVRKWLEENDML